MATRKTKTDDTDDDRDDGIVQVEDADGRVHFTAKGSAAERDITARVEKADKGKDSDDATPAVTAG